MKNSFISERMPVTINNNLTENFHFCTGLTGQKIYSSFDGSGAESFLFQDGGGDTVFT